MASLPLFSGADAPYHSTLEKRLEGLKQFIHEQVSDSIHFEERPSVRPNLFAHSIGKRIRRR
jgi:hypothetical protein